MYCAILAHGAARVHCDGCKHSLLIAFSCKRRGVCPSCGAKRAVKFAEHIYNWSRVEATALQMLEGFVHVGYLPCEHRAQKLTRLAAEVDMLRMFIRLEVDIKVLPLKKVVPLQERLDEIVRMLGGWIKSVRQR
jgi:hypothetical protein